MHQIKKMNDKFQYILIYWMIILVGSNLIYHLKSELTYAITLILVLAFFLLKRSYNMKKWYLWFCTIFLITAILTSFLTGGDLSYGTILGILTKFLIVYVAIIANVEKFVHRFIQITVLMAGISMVLWLGYTILGNNFYSLFSPFLFKGYMTKINGLFFIGFNLDPNMGFPRNSYIFGEPGKFQMILNGALFFLLFSNDSKYTVKQKIKYIALLTITVITVQSTEGYFILMILLLSYLITNKSVETTKIRHIIIVLIIGVIVYSMLYAGENNLIQTAFFEKVLNDSGNFDLNQGTASARTNGLEWYPQFAWDNPIKAIIGVGASSAEYGSAMGGILGFLFCFGLINGLIVYGVLFIKAWENRESRIGFLLIVVITILHGVSQPDLFSTITAVMMIYRAFGTKHLITT